MKYTKKVIHTIAILLAVLSAINLFSTASLAAASQSSLSYEPELAAAYGNGLLIFGDSYARGMGGTDDWESLYYMDNEPGKLAYKLDTKTWVKTTEQCRNIEGGFTYLIAQALGCNCPNDIRDTSATYWPIAHNALTLAAVMDLCGIEDNFFDDTFYHYVSYGIDRYNADLYYFGSSGKSTNADGTGTWTGTPKAKDVNELIVDSKLIVLNLGMGDIFNRTFATLKYNGLLDNLTNPVAIAKVLKLALELLDEGFDYWEKYYPVFIDYLQTLNPDATIVAVGALNTFFGTTLTHSTFAPIGTALSGLSSKMNNALKKICDDMGLIYVDISNVETGVTSEEMDISDVFANREPATHPSKRGHQQIAGMIISALKTYNHITETAKKDIVVDVGRFDTIDSVTINGISTKNYDFNNHILTVHCCTKLITSLSISAIRNGKISYTAYQVVYDDKNGYTVYRMYTTNNIFRVAENLFPALFPS